MTSREQHLAFIRQYSQPMEPIPTGQSARLLPLRNIEVVLLDVYGTLFISASGELTAEDRLASSQSLKHVLSRAGIELRLGPEEAVEWLYKAIRDQQRQRRQEGIEYPEVDILQVWSKFLNQPTEAGQLLRQPTSPPLTSDVVEAISLHYELLTNPVWPMPGVGQCLTDLASRGLRVGLVSNAQWYTPLMFPALLGGEPEALGIDPELQFWSCDSGWAKPSDCLCRQAAELPGGRGITSDRVLYIGNDMLNDILPASTTGFRTALFAGDQRSFRPRTGDSRVAGLQPDMVLVQLNDVLSCVRPQPGTED